MKTMRANIFLVTLGLSLMLSASAFAMGLRCSEIFTEKISTEQINQAIAELAALRLDIDQTQVYGNGSVARTVLKQKFDKKQMLIIQYLEQNGIMDRTQFNERLRNEISILQNRTDITESKVEKDRIVREQRVQILINATQTKVHRIAPGTFQFWSPRNSGAQITLTRPYEMTATPTTQFLWRRLVELAEARFPGQYSLAHDPSHFKGDDHPVESVNIENIQKWIKALNHLSSKGEPKLHELIAGHQQGDTYRLPTESEWTFVLQERGRLDLDLIDPNEYGWFFSKDGVRETHPVGQKNPQIIDGKEFYDMLGNVWEWTSDYFVFSDYLPSGHDPKGPAYSQKNVIRGGAFHSTSNIRDFPSAARDSEYSWQIRKNLGFRLVRDVKVHDKASSSTPKKTIWQKLTEKLRR